MIYRGAVLVLLLGEILVGCNNAGRLSTSAIRPSPCEIAHVTYTRMWWKFDDSVSVMDGRRTTFASDSDFLNHTLILRCSGANLRHDLLCKDGKFDVYVVTDDCREQRPRCANRV